MKTKLLSIIFLSITACAVLFYSCSKQKNQPRFLAEITNPMDSVGIIHNEAIEFVYTRLEANSVSALKSSQSLQLEINSSIVDYINLKNSSNPSAIKLYEEINKIKAIKSGQDASDKAKELCKDLTSCQMKYLSMIAKVAKNEKLGLKRTIKILKQIEAQAKRKCTDDELFIIFATAAVAKSTANYWHDNYQKWNKLQKKSGLKDFQVYVDGELYEYVFTNGGESMDDIDGHIWTASSEKNTYSTDDLYAFNWKSFMNSDIGGAIGGAVAYGAAMLSPSARAAAIAAPEGALVAAAITIGACAAGNSATDAYNQCIAK